MPAEESLDLLAKRVIDSGQTFSVFDLAKVLLQSRDRFRVTFESTGKKFFRCREDQSIWLTKDEALRHLWRSDWLKKFYDEVQVEGEAPKGNFSAIARCGISNELLGPPNYHEYQEKLAALHRERFSNMSLDAYKAKVRTEHGEEAVEAWLESMKTVTKWKVAEPKEEEPEVEEAEAKEATEEATGATPEAEAEVVAEAPGQTDETPAAEEPAAEAEAPAAEEPAAEESESIAEQAPAEEEEAPEEEKPVALFDDARSVERHFAENHFAEVFEETDRAWVIGDIRGNLLSPGLLTLLKRSVAEEKRYPAKLMPVVCRQLSGRHVAVFKWKKKLKVGPSRPHAVPTDTPLAERPRAIIDHLLQNSGVALKEFWEAVMPAGVTAEQKHDWFQDFQWLLSQGHIILLSDTTVHIAKRGEGDAPPARKAAAQKEARPEPEEARAAESTPEVSEPAAEAVAEAAAEPPAEKGTEPPKEVEETPNPETASEEE
jgi:hypothetical protein